MKPSKENSALKVFDQPSSEIAVLQSELQKYMIQMAFDMFKSETDALARVFELTNLRVNAFVHSAQQSPAPSARTFTSVTTSTSSTRWAPIRNS